MKLKYKYPYNKKYIYVIFYNDKIKLSSYFYKSEHTMIFQNNLAGTKYIAYKIQKSIHGAESIKYWFIVL